MQFTSSLTKEALFTFGEKKGDGAGKVASIDVTEAQTVIFRYDEATGLYTKSNCDWDPEQVHKVYNENDKLVPITATNVLVLYAPKYMENGTTCDFTLSGDGLLITGGTSREIAYSNDGNGFTFSETDDSLAAAYLRCIYKKTGVVLPLHLDG